MREIETQATTATTEPGSPVLLSTVQAATRLGLRPCTLEKWRCVGGGPLYVKLGRAVKYRTVDIDDFAFQRLRAHTAQRLPS